MFNLISFLFQFYCEKFSNVENSFSLSKDFACLEPGKTIEIIISWSPTKEGNVRDVIYWKTSLGVRSQTVILGNCVDPTAKKVKFSFDNQLFRIKTNC